MLMLSVFVENIVDMIVDYALWVAVGAWFTVLSSS